ncbi:HNH endonuclease family protein [Cellulomonas carbonis]|uniref:Deoxyribonuclease n=1 Tax=Cellulomonas carbonis T26 TaxID=947969 RepID=A0A0A0BUC5_9CELL|nr:HNH endonuclease family protein [Cellulomonas carbonis]KGM11536.1 deoxyribonuclease [Cellulomonas carbonis T26]GGC02582.1 hypothetical protein GCM10010972_14420 [Cellulomonas carbonis]
MRRRRRSRAATALATLVSVLLAGALLTATDVGADAGLPDLLGARRPTGHVVGVTQVQLDRAREDLASLEVAGRAPMTGYDRDQFGQAWADADRNGCDTRNDVLRRDLTDVVLDERTGGCVVLTGTLVDPYGGGTIAFERGERSADVQVDHVVALADAWQKGAQQWTPAQRELFANDPANLLAVDGPLNQQKGAGDAATWLPPERGFRCRYVLLQVRVKAAYGLRVTAAERDAMDRWLDRCVVLEGP